MRLFSGNFLLTLSFTLLSLFGSLDVYPAHPETGERQHVLFELMHVFLP